MVEYTFKDRYGIEDLREIVRLNGARLVPGYDVVIVARSRCVDAKYRKMEEAYLKADKKLGLLREDAE